MSLNVDPDEYLVFAAILLPEIIANPRADLVDSGNSWHDTFCPYDFVRHPSVRDEVDSWITYSRVRGAIDGKSLFSILLH